MRRDTSAGPSVRGPLVLLRHLYWLLDFDFEISIPLRIQPEVLQGDMLSLKSKIFKSVD